TNCDIQLNSRLTDLIIENGTAIGVKIRHNGKIESIFSDFVLMCTGGCSYPSTGSDGSVFKILKDLGHEIVNLRPSLVPIETAGGLAKSLMGLSLKNVRAVVWVNGKKQAEDFGEMIFTHFGLSGPIILTLSRIAVDALLKGTEVEISIDLKPALDEQKLDKRLQRDLNEHGKKQIENIFKMLLPSKMIPVFLDELKINPGKLANQVSAKERRQIRILMKDFRFKVTGYRGFDEAIITAGGVSINEIHSKTMESKLIKNLYFAGEMIDFDADTGGYNLQIAYSTAWLAAESCQFGSAH
ncbi:MAG: aminoacetone oxidase family FAD-binding enzyme, partial [Spirochaetes bacterium]|nr:aminoacetone oxidase family FAD-binding enzyme [Spirochaetota bacterium]